MRVLRSAAVGAAVVVALLGVGGPAAAEQLRASSAGPAAAQDVPPVQELRQALTVTGAYWQRHFESELGGSYVPPRLLVGANGVPGAYDVDTDTVVCGGEVVPDDVARANAVYCGAEDWLGVEDDLLARSVDLGDALVHLAAAHEWGHAVQARLSPDLVSERLELQADCFAGAALGGAAADGTLVWEEGDSAELAHALAVVADETPWSDVSDHGTAQQRIAAFTEGFDEGPRGCTDHG